MFARSAFYQNIMWYIFFLHASFILFQVLFPLIKIICGSNKAFMSV